MRRNASWLIFLFTVGFLFVEHDCLQITTWYRFATSESYKNTIIVTEIGNPLTPFTMPKDKPLMLARMECSQACLLESSCVGFNFYTQGDVYICQLLQENFCTHTARIALQAWPGGSVWDKLRPSESKSCLDRQFLAKTTAELCEIMRPGCQGTWPSCNDCVKSCSDCRKYRPYSNDGYYSCTVWPEGPASIPIFSYCASEKTYIVTRNVDWYNGYEISRYVMSFSDVERVVKLNIYHTLHFYFRASDTTEVWAVYRFSSINSNGTITNLQFEKSADGIDGFGLNGQARSFDFININSDPYGCGSFWLLDLHNAKFCPGGKVGMVGAVLKWVSSGIHWPSFAGKVIILADMKLGL